ncbi:hypothetical protein EVAR_4313_1 [Eumeta japonica]|uniref:Uncharacterized protein n=1 Tax=Eumeta variegata TaxID=151549 RepID=A0A4C1VC15_EUMVA|nr:hypothetical protein EVAR_4313_1 [Eumeta japonica]
MKADRQNKCIERYVQWKGRQGWRQKIKSKKGRILSTQNRRACTTALSDVSEVGEICKDRYRADRGSEPASRSMMPVRFHPVCGFRGVASSATDRLKTSARISLSLSKLSHFETDPSSGPSAKQQNEEPFTFILDFFVNCFDMKIDHPSL